MDKRVWSVQQRSNIEVNGSVCSALCSIRHECQVHMCMHVPFKSTCISMPCITCFYSVARLPSFFPMWCNCPGGSCSTNIPLHDYSACVSLPRCFYSTFGPPAFQFHTVFYLQFHMLGHSAYASIQGVFLFQIEKIALILHAASIRKSILMSRISKCDYTPLVFYYSTFCALALIPFSAHLDSICTSSPTIELPPLLRVRF